VTCYQGIMNSTLPKAAISDHYEESM